MSNNSFWQAVTNRRTYYAIGSDSPVSKEDILEIVKNAAYHSPSAFNTQTHRALVLFGQDHHDFWDIVLEALRSVTPDDQFTTTENKIFGFRSGFGTVLFFEEQDIIHSMQEQFALYKDYFPVWSLNSTGMFQYIVWTGLRDAGLGASLQHYNPLIDEQVKKRWNIPESWKLWAEMPFGNILEEPGAKEQNLPIEERVRTAGLHESYPIL